MSWNSTNERPRSTRLRTSGVGAWGRQILSNVCKFSTVHFSAVSTPNLVIQLSFFSIFFDIYKMYTRLHRSTFKIPAKFRETLGKKSQISSIFSKIQEEFAKILKIHRNLNRISQTFANFEFGTVQRFMNLVDLEKCWKITIWLQKSASIQPRTSLPKFDQPALLPTPPWVK